MSHPPARSSRRPRRGRRRKPYRRWWVGAPLALVGLALVWLVICSQVVLNPRVDHRIEKADAVLVLGPSDKPRVALAQRLMAEGKADTVVYSTPQVSAQDPTVDELEREASQCREQHDYEILCFPPNPSTTQGEAIKLRELADQRGWDSVIVVTMRPHISRAQLIVGRCYTGRTQWAAVDYVDPYWQYPEFVLQQFVYQSAGYLKAWVTPGCATQLPWQPKTR